LTGFASFGIKARFLVQVCLSFNIFHSFVSSLADGNQQASLKDPLHVPVGPITRARSKMIKEAISGLIQEIRAGSKTEHSNLGPKEDGVINLIQAIDGVDLA
jgi:hypothetical protein